VPSDRAVLIAGASFAGLAVAQILRERALLVDPDEIGDGQTSACGAPVRVLQALGAEASIQDVQHDLVIHTPGREVRWAVPEPFCTFDYRACCRAAFAGSGAAFVRASVQGRRGAVALTSAGELPARVLVDATGWRAAMAGLGIRREYHGGPRRSPRAEPERAKTSPTVGTGASAGAGRYFGLEAEVPASWAAGLHFYFWPEIVRDGYAWVFPAGRVARVGVLSFRARSHLGSSLDMFLRRLGLPSGPRHGGFLGIRLRPPVVDGAFVVGDAAGQCLPFTGEGIRSAVWAGQVCGGLVRRVLDGEISAADAAVRYTRYVERQRRRYRVLEWSTLAALSLPARALGRMAAWVARPGPLHAFMRHYLSIFAPEEPAAV
jgi:digeranylgeranylglycerophospholipid reductase